MRRFFASLLSAALLLSLVGGLATSSRAASIPSGTQIQVRLAQKLETGETKTGQTFSATVAQPVVVNGKTVLAKGARVNGHVTEAVSSGRLKGKASITLELTQASGAAVHTEPLRIDGKSHLLRDAGLIGGGAAAGALIGGATGGKKGAAIGAVVGAGAGTATAYITGKQEIALPAEMALTFVVGGAGGKTAAATASSSSEAESAEPGGKDMRGEGGGAHEARDVAKALMFSARDQQMIRQYFRTNTANLPPGLAKRGGNLPPGLERQVERNGTLPPGLQKRIEPFPTDLTQRLPRLPAGYSRVILGRRALILDAANKILDLMHLNE